MGQFAARGLIEKGEGFKKNMNVSPLLCPDTEKEIMKI